MSVVAWLLESDPAIRWQVLAGLTDAEPEDVAGERALVATEGWGAQLLALQGEDGQWAGGTYFPGGFSWSSMPRGEDGRVIGQPWNATFWSLTLLRLFGLDPDSEQARDAVAGVKANSRWEHDGQPFFEGEVEPCINGATVAAGAYFGVEVAGIVDRLLGEQMADGGWNCEQENGSIRGSFHTTISVLEGFLEFMQRFGSDPSIQEAQANAQEYLLERRLYKRLSTGEPINERWTLFAFPNWWHYDVLRGLDYMRRAEVQDERLGEALDLVEERRLSDGRWARGRIHPGTIHFDIDAPEGEPSKWITLRALRVLKWAGRT